MIAAIYARKSTDQSAIVDEAKSVTRQIAHATTYATGKGWTVPEACIFVDDGISGAEFANRPGFVRLMAALKPRPPFQVLIMSEESRLGREAIETAYALKQLITAGVRVFFYLEDRERTFDSPTDKLLMSVTAFADELEREKARQRTYDAMHRKAAAGQVTGGRVFGYDNIEVLDANGERSHVERRINEAEAAVVRRMFELCAAGAGLTRITKTLNAEGVPAPRPQLGRPHAWATSSVRAVLRRALYKGEVVWNQSRKRDGWGKKRQQARPQSEWMRTSVPALRIVSEELWTRAHAQLEGRTAQFTGSRAYCESRYLLSGLARCSLCGGGFASHSRTHGKERVKFYACTSHWKRGPEVCGNGLVGRMDLIDGEILATLRDDILRPSVVERAVALVLEELSPRRMDASAGGARQRAREGGRGAGSANGHHHARRRGGAAGAARGPPTGAPGYARDADEHSAAERGDRPPGGAPWARDTHSGEARRLARALDTQRRQRARGAEGVARRAASIHPGSRRAAATIPVHWCHRTGSAGHRRNRPENTYWRYVPSGIRH
jgi:DNA invertase Pin-like site-specific DNA recombinase